MNPLHLARLQLNLTQTDLAGLAGITPNAIALNEAGVYPDPSPAILLALRGFGFDRAALTEQYWDWQIETRANNASPPYLLPEITGASHPFINFRTTNFEPQSQLGWCKLACVHPAVLAKYETNEQRTMPEQVSTALRGLGMEEFDLADLKARIRTWDSNRRNNRAA